MKAKASSSSQYKNPYRNRHQECLPAQLNCFNAPIAPYAHTQLVITSMIVSLFLRKTGWERSESVKRNVIIAYAYVISDAVVGVEVCVSAVDVASITAAKSAAAAVAVEREFI